MIFTVSWNISLYPHLCFSRPPLRKKVHCYDKSDEKDDDGNENGDDYEPGNDNGDNCEISNDNDDN